MARFAKQYQFWLDLNKEAESQIAEAINRLKEHRLYSATIRDGIRLVCSLRNGDSSVLLELFPWVKEALSDCSNDASPEPSPAQLQNTIENTVKAALETHIPRYLPTGSLQRPAARGPAPGDVLDLPTLEVTPAAKDERNSSTWNFMLSSATLLGNLDSLPSNVIQYGLEVGRFQEAISVQAQKILDGRNRIPPKVIHAVESGPREMVVPQFTAPALNDELDDSLLTIGA